MAKSPVPRRRNIWSTRDFLEGEGGRNFGFAPVKNRFGPTDESAFSNDRARACQVANPSALFCLAGPPRPQLLPCLPNGRHTPLLVEIQALSRRARWYATPGGRRLDTARLAMCRRP